MTSQVQPWLPMVSGALSPAPRLGLESEGERSTVYNFNGLDQAEAYQCVKRLNDQESMVESVIGETRSPNGLKDIAGPDGSAGGNAGGQNDTDAEYDYYKALLQRQGIVLDGSADMKNLVAIRHPTNTNENGGKGLYDDTAVLLWIDGDGKKHVSRYRANTEPTSQYVKEKPDKNNPDMNHDGKGEVARLPAGTYVMEHHWDKNKEGSVGDGNVFTQGDGPKKNAQYDVDHDGFFYENFLGEGAETMWWHRGKDGNVVSAGCQTMDPADWDRFIADMGVDREDDRWRDRWGLNPFAPSRTLLRYTLVDEDVSKGNVPYKPA
ncbi:hypothetical protein [Nocardia inohanensis]|uniref:hypothetical protein n=1 Tax=Nocardia inohanensis TaxID=209246 RepID=UPI001470D8E9|nr:hypothetical protein [Nocardia inohanensis]